MVYSTWKKAGVTLREGSGISWRPPLARMGPTLLPGVGHEISDSWKGRSWQRDHKVLARKPVKKEQSPDSFLPSSPFLRKGRVLKIQNCLFKFRIK